MGPVGRLGVLWAQREGWECYGPSGKDGNAMGPVGRLGVLWAQREDWEHTTQFDLLH